MAIEFAPVILMAGFVFVALLPLLILSAVFSPKKPTPMKLAPFECGQTPSGTARVHLLMQYYTYLLLYVVLDVISMFLFAWAVTYVYLGPFTGVVMASFILALLAPLGYALLLARRKELW